MSRDKIDHLCDELISGKCDHKTRNGLKTLLNYYHGSASEVRLAIIDESWDGQSGEIALRRALATRKLDSSRRKSRRPRKRSSMRFNEIRDTAANWGGPGESLETGGFEPSRNQHWADYVISMRGDTAGLERTARQHRDDYIKFFEWLSTSQDAHAELTRRRCGPDFAAGLRRLYEVLEAERRNGVQSWPPAAQAAPSPVGATELDRQFALEAAQAQAQVSLDRQFTMQQAQSQGQPPPPLGRQQTDSDLLNESLQRAAAASPKFSGNILLEDVPPEQATVQVNGVPTNIYMIFVRGADHLGGAVWDLKEGSPGPKQSRFAHITLHRGGTDPNKNPCGALSVKFQWAWHVPAPDGSGRPLSTLCLKIDLVGDLQMRFFAVTSEGEVEINPNSDLLANNFQLKVRGFCTAVGTMLYPVLRQMQNN